MYIFFFSFFYFPVFILSLVMCTGMVELGWWNGDAGRRMCQCQLILVLYTDDDGTIYTEYYGTAAISISVSLLWSRLCLRPDLCVDRQKKKEGACNFDSRSSHSTTLSKRSTMSRSFHSLAAESQLFTAGFCLRCSNLELSTSSCGYHYPFLLLVTVSI